MDSCLASDGVVDEQTAVRLVLRPQQADTLVGLRVREQIKRTGLLRGVFLALWVFELDGGAAVTGGLAGHAA